MTQYDPGREYAKQSRYDTYQRTRYGWWFGDRSTGNIYIRLIPIKYLHVCVYIDFIVNKDIY